MIIICIICVFAIYNLIAFSEPIFMYLKLDYIAKSAAQAIEEDGQISGDLTSLIGDLRDSYNINDVRYDFQWQFTRLGGSEKLTRSGGYRAVDLRERFEVEVSATVKVKLADFAFGALSFDMPVRASARGVGQRYWRPYQLY